MTEPPGLWTKLGGASGGAADQLPELPPGGSSCVIKTQFVHHGNSKSLHFISLIIINIGNSDVTNQ